VNVTTGAVSVATTAIALADARVGDQIDVRLQRPARTLRTRVTAPGSVQLIDGSQ
jgi:flagella basal body P-ring formation protein FlgA